MPPEVTTLAGAGASVVVVTGGSGASVVVVVGGGAPVVVVTGTVGVVVGVGLPVGKGAPKRTRFVCDNASLNRDALNDECDPAP